jgi:hypothetical protein
MEILIDISLYLFAIAVSIAFGNIFKESNESIARKLLKNEGKNKYRRYDRGRWLFRNLRS